MDPKTRWSDKGPASILRGNAESVELPLRRPTQARVLRGSPPSGDSVITIGLPVSPRPPSKQIQRTMSRTDRPDEIRVEYDPDRYGLVHIETVEERERRHIAELTELNSRLEQARAEIIAARGQGRNEGIALGLEKGREQALQEVEADHRRRIEQVQQLLNSCAAATRDYYARVEERLAGFALRIARRIVGDAVTRHEGIATRLAREALQQASERTVVTLLCNPDDERELNSAVMELKTVSEGIREIEVKSSTHVSRGGVILESNSGSIDATIETLLSELQIAVLDGEPPVEEAET